jgi:hypothetical protein
MCIFTLPVAVVVGAGLVILTIHPKTWQGMLPTAVQIDQNLTAGFAVLMVTFVAIAMIGLRGRYNGFGYWALLAIMCISFVVASLLISKGLATYMPNSSHPPFNQ